MPVQAAGAKVKQATVQNSVPCSHTQTPLPCSFRKSPELQAKRANVGIKEMVGLFIPPIPQQTVIWPR